MSRLDSFIRRMQSQRACIDAAAHALAGLPGHVLELGLGNGRTYDHLRHRFADRPIYVFERAVAAHPDCIPPEDLLRLGDFRTTLPAFAAEGRAPAAFIHGDIGSADKQASVQLAATLAHTMRELLAVGGYLACDQPVELAGLDVLPLPAGADAGSYHFYRRSR